MAYSFMSADEAARLIKNGDVIATSGFTASGAPKELPTAIARYADEEHKAGREFKVSLFSGASTGDSCDGELARAKALDFRTPYQSSKDLRTAINAGEVRYVDAHLSQLAQELRYGTYGQIDVAIIEAADLSANGDILLTAGVGNAPTYARLAKKIIVEINDMHPKSILGMHDLYEPSDPPYRKEIPIFSVKDRVGTLTLKVDPSKIIAVVNTHRPNEVGKFTPIDETTAKIGQNVAKFIASQLKSGFLPKEFLPIQSGVGNVANAVLDGSDCVMLSGESASGKYPVEAVKTMAEIALQAEAMLDYRKYASKSTLLSHRTKNEAIGIAVAESCLTLDDVCAVIAFTETGGTAKRIARFRPVSPVIAATNSRKTARKMALYFGVYAVIDADITEFIVNDKKQLIQNKINQNQIENPRITSPEYSIIPFNEVLSIPLSFLLPFSFLLLHNVLFQVHLHKVDLLLNVNHLMSNQLILHILLQFP